MMVRFVARLRAALAAFTAARFHLCREIARTGLGAID
jgi:hypothetical protein